MSVILMTTVFYKALILQGEIWCWALLGIKGLTDVSSLCGLSQCVATTPACGDLYHVNGTMTIGNSLSAI